MAAFGSVYVMQFVEEFAPESHIFSNQFLSIILAVDRRSCISTSFFTGGRYLYLL